MKRSIAIAAYLLCLAGLLLLIPGCGGGGGGGDDFPETRTAIGDRIAAFARAVEAYDLDGMLDFLDSTDFTPTIAENGSSYDKNYGTLADELEEDEPKQLHWRNPAPQGHGYILTMELGAIAFDNLSASGGIATVPFTIKEAAEGISEMVTDTGHMVCEMANLEGAWRCQKMTIHFDSPGGTGAVQARSGRGTGTGGFGFGRLDLGWE